jgi:hypothetical protein
MGGSPRYLASVVEHFSGVEVATIVLADIRGSALTMFPHLKASTINRKWTTRTSSYGRPCLPSRHSIRRGRQNNLNLF